MVPIPVSNAPSHVIVHRGHEETKAFQPRTAVHRVASARSSNGAPRWAASWPYRQLEPESKMSSTFRVKRDIYAQCIRIRTKKNVQCM